MSGERFRRINERDGAKRTKLRIQRFSDASIRSKLTLPEQIRKSEDFDLSPSPQYLAFAIPLIAW